MANTNVFETKLSKRMQITRYSTPVYVAQASFEERAGLSDGEAVVRPTFATLIADDYTRGTDMTEQGYTEGSETLTVNQTPALLLRVDDFDALQHKTNIQQRVTQDGMRAVNKKIDAKYLAQSANATHTVDDGDVGGTSGNGISADATNIIKAFSASQRKLQLKDVDIVGQKDPRPDAGNMKPGGAMGFANMNPYINEQLVLSLSGRETVDGDLVGKNAYKRTFFEFDSYITTNGFFTSILGMAANPTAADTIVINGVTVTFVAALTGAAAEIHITSTADLTRANLVEWLNAGGEDAEAEATDTGYSAASAASIKLLKRMSAVNDNDNDIMTLSAEGYGYVVLSETFTDTTDTWNTGKEKSHQLFGQKGACDMVLQDNVKVKISDIPKQHGVYVKPRALYGIKMFAEGADASVSVDFDSSSWV